MSTKDDEQSSDISYVKFHETATIEEDACSSKSIECEMQAEVQKKLQERLKELTSKNKAIIAEQAQ